MTPEHIRAIFNTPNWKKSFIDRGASAILGQLEIAWATILMLHDRDKEKKVIPTDLHGQLKFVGDFARANGCTDVADLLTLFKDSDSSDSTTGIRKRRG